MKIEDFIDILKRLGVKKYFGVPDSLLNPLCNYLYNENNHENIIAPNEGIAVAMAAGFYLSSKKMPCIYMQNSGLGNAMNPIVSLLSEKVYAIPSVFVIGWRGEPNKNDEPQHIFQGEITEKFLDMLNVYYYVINEKTCVSDLSEFIEESKNKISQGKSIAFLVKKNAFLYEKKINYTNSYSLLRENIIEEIVKVSGDDLIVSTTGKTSRELFEVREKYKLSHNYDFLTVGSMGHSSSIALEIALNHRNKNVWCLDGDGAALMHLGAIAMIGAKSPRNFYHILLNNEAHESVGGHPTIGQSINFSKIALAVGYKNTFCIDNQEDLQNTLIKLKSLNGPVFLEIKTKIGSRKDLGRPTNSPIVNKELFINNILEV